MINKPFLNIKLQPKYHLLTTNLFILGLILLLLNDLYFKYQFHNILTGKLSDFAGLFIFPYFISVFINKPKKVYLLTAVFFMWWKLEYSQLFIDTITRVTNCRIYRTVDYTDLIALSILPLSFQYFKQKEKAITTNHFAISIFICSISIFSFCATTVPKESNEVAIKLNKEYRLPINKLSLFKKLNYYYNYSDTLTKNLNDTLFYLYFIIPEHNAEATVIAKIISIKSDSTSIKLDSLVNYNFTGVLFEGVKDNDKESCKKLNSNEIETLFKNNFIDIVLGKKSTSENLRFDNKAQIDKYHVKNRYR